MYIKLHYLKNIYILFRKEKTWIRNERITPNFILESFFHNWAEFM